MKIIFGTDFSENASVAGRAAAALARRWGDTLTIAHVVDEPQDLHLPQEVVETTAAFLAARLHEEAGKLTDTGCRIDEHMLAGTPDQALTKLADQSSARLIVVSSLGRRSGEWLLGSVSERTVEHSTVPTLIVRSTEVFEAWASGERPLKIFVAFDFTQTAEQALDWVKQLQAIGPCEVVIGYVDWPLMDASRLGIWWSPLDSTNPPEVQEILTRDLRDRAARLLGETPVRVRCEPSMGRPDARLIEIATEENADLIVTGTHQRSGMSRAWHPSTSRALVRYAPMSVLCVPVSDEAPRPLQSATIRRVVAAVDLCEHGGRAIPFAYGIVQAGGAVRLVHVARPLGTINPLIGGYPHQYIPTKKEHADSIATARERLAAMAPEDALARGIVTDVEVIESDDIAKAIRQAGERFDAEVICVGAHNRSGISRAILGSVAREVMAQSGRPTLVVRETER